MTSHTESARRIWGDLKKSVSGVETGREGSTFGARRGQTNLRATGAARDEVGADGKARIERMCILAFSSAPHLVRRP